MSPEAKKLICEIGELIGYEDLADQYNHVSFSWGRWEEDEKFFMILSPGRDPKDFAGMDVLHMDEDGSWHDKDEDNQPRKKRTANYNKPEVRDACSLLHPETEAEVKIVDARSRLLKREAKASLDAAGRAEFNKEVKFLSCAAYHRAVLSAVSRVGLRMVGVRRKK